MQRHHHVQHRFGLFIFSFAFSISLMASAETLAMLGPLFGHTGIRGMGLIFLVTVVYLALVRLYQQRLFVLDRAPGKKNTACPRQIQATAVLSLIVKTLAVLYLATGILVSAGFAFNEIFVYWFPNFAFAYLLLAILVFFQFLDQRTRFYLQAVFAGISVVGLLILIIFGLTQTGLTLPEHPVPFPNANPFRVGIYLTALLLFVGFDLGFVVTGSGTVARKTVAAAMMSAVLFMGFLFLCWGYLMLAQIPGPKLAHTTIAHIITARKILGSSGRYIMGTIIIFGTLSVVHALFTYISYEFSILCQTIKLPPKLKKSRIMIILLAIIIGSMMGSGMAGGEKLEVFIKAFLAIWFLSYVVTILMNPKPKKGEKDEAPSNPA